MSDLESEIKVALRWIAEQNSFKIEFQSDCMNDLTVDWLRVPIEKRGGEARRLLAASLAECMGSTVFFMLKYANVEFKDFRAVADVTTAKDEKGRVCVDKISLTMHVGIPKNGETLKKVQRIKNLLNRGCLISRSLERGIKVQYSLLDETSIAT